MPRFRYRFDDGLTGRWFKGNTHLHSIASDGKKTVSELGALYRQAGYDFLCLTDHWVASRLAPDETGGGLLWINGVEMDGPDARGVKFHLVGLGDFTGVDSSLSLEDGVQAVQAQGGFLILAHPFWMGISLEDSGRFVVDAVEVYNHVCRRDNGKEDGSVFWLHLLGRNPDILAIACDDAHFIYDPPPWNGGWLMVHAAECTRPAILSALRAGRFYASSGPEFRRIALDGSVVTVETSPVEMIWLVGPGYKGRFQVAPAGQEITSAAFEVPPDWPYAFLQAEDRQRRRAWTNTLFTASDPAPGSAA